MSDLWAETADKIRGKVGELNYNKWFSSISHIKTDGSVIFLAVPSSFVADWLKDYYTDVIKDALQGVSGTRYEIKFEVRPDLAPPQSNDPAGGEEGRAGETISPSKFDEHIVRRYGFDRFVVGSQNQMAAAAAKAVADLPGGHYNPLFIYGGVGLGKTHLLNAIGIALTERYPQMRVIYISSERFMNELINCIRYERMPEFRNKYRDSCDVLLMDDIQFLGGKERTQEEFFHTFNCLHESQKQIVVTSDRLPKEIAKLEDRLKSRFEWGLIADIQPPDLETRIAILKKKAEVESIPLSDDIALYLATNIKSNVRELEGSLIRLGAYSSFSGERVTIEMAREKLKGIIREHASIQTIESIQQLVADRYQLKLAELRSPRRTKNLAVPRQIAMYLCKKHLKTSFPEIGNRFGGKDHTTVIHACRKIDRLVQEDPRLKEEVELLERQMSS